MVGKYINLRVVLLIFLTAFLFFGIFWQIDKRIRADEWIWVPLGVRFIESVKKGEFEETQVSARPGVTVAWVSGTVSTISDRYINENIRLIPDSWRVFVPRDIYFLNRVVFGGLSILLLLVSFFTLTKIMKWSSALLVTTLIGTHFYFIFTGTLVWTDLFLALFLFLAIITLLLYEKWNKWYLLLTTGILFGLALATKTSAITLVPAIFMASFLTEFSWSNFKSAFFKTCAVFGVGIFTYYLIYPFLWTNIMGIFDRYSELSNQIKNTEVLEDGFFSPFYYFVVALKANPVVFVFALIFAPYLLIKSFLEKKVDLNLLLPICFLVIYTGLLIFVSQFEYFWGSRIASERYTLPTILCLFLLFILSIEKVAKGNLRLLWAVPIIAILYNLFYLVKIFEFEIVG